MKMFLKIVFFKYILIYSVTSNNYTNYSISNQNVIPETEITPTEINFTNEVDYINLENSRNSNIIIPRLPTYVSENITILNENAEIQSKNNENSTNIWIATPLKKTYSGNVIKIYQEKSANFNRRGILNGKEKTEVSDYLKNRNTSHTFNPYQNIINKRMLRELVEPETNFAMYGDISKKYLNNISSTISNEIKSNRKEPKNNLWEFPIGLNRTLEAQINKSLKTTTESFLQDIHVINSVSEYVSKYITLPTSKQFTNKVVTLYTIPIEKSKLSAKMRNKNKIIEKESNFDVYSDNLGNDISDKSNDEAQGENTNELSDDEEFPYADSEHNSEENAENSNDMSQVENMNRDFEENEYDQKEDNDYEIEESETKTKSTIATHKVEKNVDKNDFAFYGDALVQLKFTETPLKDDSKKIESSISSANARHSDPPLSSKMYYEKSLDVSKVFPEDVTSNIPVKSDYLLKPKVLRDLKKYDNRGNNMKDNSSDILQGFLHQEMHQLQRKKNRKLVSTEKYFKPDEETKDIYRNNLKNKSRRSKIDDIYDEPLVETEDLNLTNNEQNNIEEKSIRKKKIENQYEIEQIPIEKKTKEFQRNFPKLKATQHSIQKGDKSSEKDFEPDIKEWNGKSVQFKEDYSKENLPERKTASRIEQDKEVMLDKADINMLPLTFETVDAELNYPYVVMYIFEPNQVYCDAVTISAYWILSSATCLIHSYDDQTKQGYVAFCSSTWWDTEFTAMVLEAMIQKKYFGMSEKKDGANVGIARVAKDMSLCNTWYAANIIKRPVRADRQGSSATAVGWGLYRIKTLEKDEEDIKVPNTSLRSVKTKVMPGLCPGTNRHVSKKDKIMKKYLRSMYYCMEVNPADEGVVVPEVGGVLIMKKYVVGIASEVIQFNGKRYTLYTAVWNTSDWLHPPSKRDIRPDLQSDPEALLNPLNPDDAHTIHDDAMSLVTPLSTGTEKLGVAEVGHNLKLQKSLGNIIKIDIFILSFVIVYLYLSL